MNIRTIFKNSIAYGLSKYLNIIAAIFLTPIYTRLLSKSDYGIMDIFTTWNSLVIYILPLGLTTAIIRIWPDIKDVTEKKKTLGTMLTTLLISCVVYAILAGLLFNSFFSYFDVSSEYKGIYLLSIGIVFFNISIDFFLNIMRSSLQVTDYTLNNVFRFLILSSLGFVLVYYYRTGIIGFFYASITALTFSFLHGIYKLKNYLILCFDKVIFKKIIKYSIHLMSILALFQLTNVIDRYLILNYLDIENAGLYAIAIKIAGILTILISSFGTAWMPIVMNHKDDPDSNIFFKRIHNIYYIIFGLLAITMVLFKNELFAFFAPDYIDSSMAYYVLVSYNFIVGLNVFYSIGLHIKYYSKALTLATISSIFFNLIISILLVNKFGILGVAIGTLAGSFPWIFVQLYFSEKLYPIMYNWRYIMIFFPLYLLAIFISYKFFPYNNGYQIFDILIKVLFLLFVSVTIFLLRKKELKNIRKKIWPSKE